MIRTGTTYCNHVSLIVKDGIGAVIGWWCLLDQAPGVFLVETSASAWDSYSRFWTLDLRVSGIGAGLYVGYCFFPSQRIC